LGTAIPQLELTLGHAQHNASRHVTDTSVERNSDKVAVSVSTT